MYDITDFIKDHPGGRFVEQAGGGKEKFLYKKWNILKNDFIIEHGHSLYLSGDLHHHHVPQKKKRKEKKRNEKKAYLLLIMLHVIIANFYKQLRAKRNFLFVVGFLTNNPSCHPYLSIRLGARLLGTLVVPPPLWQGTCRAGEASGGHAGWVEGRDSTRRVVH